MLTQTVIQNLSQSKLGLLNEFKLENHSYKQFIISYQEWVELIAKRNSSDISSPSKWIATCAFLFIITIFDTGLSKQLFLPAIITVFGIIGHYTFSKVNKYWHPVIFTINYAQWIVYISLNIATLGKYNYLWYAFFGFAIHYQLRLVNPNYSIPIHIFIGTAAIIATNYLFGDYKNFFVQLCILYSVELFVMFDLRSEREQERENEQIRLALDATIINSQNSRIDEISNDLMHLSKIRHDLRNTFSVISCGLECVQHSTEEELDEILSDMRDAMSKIKSILDNDLRIGFVKGDTKKVKVMDIINSGIRLVHRKYPKTSFYTHPTSEVIDFIGGDVSFFRLIENIFTNAAEGNGNEGASSIFVTFNCVDADLEIIVEDDGPGFAPSQLASMQPFSTSKRNGSGLGLFTCSELVRANGGRLIKSNSDLGAKIKIILPRISECVQR